MRRLAEHFKARGAAWMDLSVLHDNESAIALYEKLGFRRVPVFAIKRKNPINERLFTGTAPEDGLNPYARIIVDEARRRGIAVEVIDAAGGFFRLTYRRPVGALPRVAVRVHLGRRDVDLRRQAGDPPHRRGRRACACRRR